MNHPPVRIWMIAGVCWVTSLFTLAFTWLNWLHQRLDNGNNLLGLLVVSAALLFPGMLGYWLVLGKRWVRWLFLLLILAAMLVVLLALVSPGLGPDAESEPISLTLPLAFLGVAVVFAVIVFHYFARGSEA